MRYLIPYNESILKFSGIPKEFSISYVGAYDPTKHSGTHYTQSINLTEDTVNKLNVEIEKEISSGYPQRRKYGETYYLKPLRFAFPQGSTPDFGKFEINRIFINLTTLSFINFTLNLNLSMQKNTYIKVLDGEKLKKAIQKRIEKRFDL